MASARVPVRIYEWGPLLRSHSVADGPSGQQPLLALVAQIWRQLSLARVVQESSSDCVETNWRIAEPVMMGVTLG